MAIDYLLNNQEETDNKDRKIRCFPLSSGVSATFSMAVTL
jgi:hypothetical protein